MSDMTIQSQDPSVEWSDLLHGLPAALHQAVVESLRHSARSGWPASREAVSSLVAFALGRISSREYAVQILVALGYAEERTASALLARPSEPPAAQPVRPSSYFDAGAGADFLTI